MRAMPVVASSSYRPPFFLGNAHLQTVWPTLFRKVEGVNFERVRLPTTDGDFLLLDWLRGPAPGGALAILSHGLEGNSQRPYMTGMARALRAQGFDVLAWNFRGCGGELNATSRFYHSGETADLRMVIERATGSYNRICLVGFSVGGNVTLRYLGEAPDQVDTRVERAVVFSVPCDLGASALQLTRRMNTIYLTHFMRSLRAKIREKAEHFPDAFALGGLAAMRNFMEFDEGITAPMFGFSSAADYYARASSRPVLEAILVPTLLVNAQDDPFLNADCFPRNEAEQSGALHLEMPAHGGHVGFVGGHNGRDAGWYWSERRAVEWLADVAPGQRKAPRGASTGAARESAL
jgi:predicted alpha/beta-fold hydrolase